MVGSSSASPLGGACEIATLAIFAFAWYSARSQKPYSQMRGRALVLFMLIAVMRWLLAGLLTRRHRCVRTDRGSSGGGSAGENRPVFSLQKQEEGGWPCARRFPGFGDQMDEGMAVTMGGEAYQHAYLPPQPRQRNLPDPQDRRQLSPSTICAAELGRSIGPRAGKE